jgi:glyoxylate utilization-related uncharacterized protein
MGAQEFILVFSGELTVTADGKTFVLRRTGLPPLRADRPHEYRSTGGEVCRLSMVIF